ncbi:MAG TPA: ABC transporter substrate-binding protein [Bradyrhizobium sp.]|nr:ABC transporter substrate-binding protein [Bradyrhizobium sp.]
MRITSFMASCALSATCLLLAATAGAEEPKLKAVGVTVGDLGNPFFVQIGKGAEIQAKKLGGPNTKVTVVSSGYDLNRQVGQIDDFIASKVDLIILNAADSKGIGPAVERAKKAGIKVVAVDVAAPGADATVTSNNVQAGEAACQYLSDRIKGTGSVVIINGPPVSAVIDRVNGCKSVLSKAPGIKILSDNQNAGGSRDGGLAAMTSLLTANPKIDAVFAINDPTGIGADLAAKQAQRNEFFVVGVDGAPDAEVALKQKNSLFAATAAQDPLVMAERAVEVGYGLMGGKKPATDPTLIPVKLVTRETIGEYKGWTTAQ